MKIKSIILVLILGVITCTNALGQGITFFEGTWEEAVNKAEKEDKIIFIDFYAQWCGPCLHMTESVFTLPDVATFYNNNFVCIKVDAENGEGIELAEKYGVNKYPTYVFVNATTGNVIHESSGRQSGEQFIYTGYSAKTPKLRSFFLIQNYENGNQGTDFLIDFINYQFSVHNSKMVREAFDTLISNGEKLTNSSIWKIFNEKIVGYDNPYIKYISDNYTTFCGLFGKEVDRKLSKETLYMPLDLLNDLCDFEGKSFNMEMIKINQDIRSQKYDEAVNRIDSLLENKTINKELLIKELEFIVRQGLYQEESEEWFEKCLYYARYIAYNKSDRQDPYIHQTYAFALETVLKQLINGEIKTPPAFLGEEPRYGRKEYTMRSEKLKSKPIKSK